MPIIINQENFNNEEIKELLSTFLPEGVELIFEDAEGQFALINLPIDGHTEEEREISAVVMVENFVTNEVFFDGVLMIDGRRYSIDVEDGHRHLNPAPPPYVITDADEIEPFTHLIELIVGRQQANASVPSSESGSAEQWHSNLLLPAIYDS